MDAATRDREYAGATEISGALDGGAPELLGQYLERVCLLYTSDAADE